MVFVAKGLYNLQNADFFLRDNFIGIPFMHIGML